MRKVCPLPGTDPSRSRTKTRWRILIALALVFFVDCAMNLIGIGFPVYWHPDEISKAQQLQSGSYNFFHPLLMLQLATLAKAVSFTDGSVREIVVSGRLVSVVATGTAVTALAALVIRHFNFTFGVVAAVLLACSVPVFINAHFFKEDATLLMCVALTMLAMQSFSMRATRLNLAYLGLCLGLATSAKYIGILMVFPVIGLMSASRAKISDMALCAISAFVPFLVINAPGIFGASDLRQGLASEIHHISSYHYGGVSWGPLSTRNILNFWHSTPAAIIVLWITGMVTQFRRQPEMDNRSSFEQQRGSGNFDKVVVFTPLLWLATIQFSEVALSRYLLPATALATVAAVWTVAAAFRSGLSPVIRYGLVALLILGGADTARSFLVAVSIFRDDPRTRLVDWIAANVPFDARIASLNSNGLPTPERHRIDPSVPLLPQSISVGVFLSAGATLDKLRAAGFTHIVISNAGYGALLDDTGSIRTEAAASLRRFYEEVFATLQPIHEEPLRTNVDPHFTVRHLVYDIRKQPRT